MERRQGKPFLAPLCIHKTITLDPLPYPCLAAEKDGRQ